MALIYVLDDDPLLGQTIRNMIESLGHSCENFVERDAFISATSRAVPDAIVVDMWLGATTGVKVVAENADLLAGIPAILMSGGNGNASLEKVTAIADIEGFREVLYKPFQRDDLKAVFARHLRSDVA